MLTIFSAAFTMKHLAAYLLLSLGGNSSPSAKDIKKVLDSVGIEADDDRLSTLISELSGKDLSEVYIYIRGRRTT
jgi:large subunit ribosomal protein LP2